MTWSPRRLKTCGSRFHDSHWWWGRVKGKPVQEDSVSKFRTLVHGWRNRDVRGQPLTLARVPGVIGQLQGFRGTVCSVREIDALRRLINAEVSPAYLSSRPSKDTLIAAHQQLTRRLVARTRSIPPGCLAGRARRGGRWRSHRASAPAPSASRLPVLPLTDDATKLAKATVDALHIAIAAAQQVEFL